MSHHGGRYREIAETLSRHGLGSLVGVLGIERWVPLHHGLLGHEARTQAYTQPEHLRLALEELGATWVKLGQILSTRSDLLHPAYQAELAKLQDGAPTVPADTIAELVMAELGQAPDVAFASFEAEPLAAASIGQAHAATLHDGTEVVVKVRRPGIVEVVEQDLEILRNLAAHASRHWPAAADYDVVGLADEFAQTLTAELDYLCEGRNAERIAQNFAQDDEVHIPRVFWATTTSRVLTLERVRGIKIDDTGALDAAGIDRRALARLATRVTAQMVFEDGFFHADPHPGNFFVEAGGGLGILDFGMVGEVGERLRGQLGALLVGLAQTDSRRIADAVLAIATAHGPVDRAALRSDLAALIDGHRGRSVGELRLGALVEEALAIVRRHHLRLPREMALLLKMVAMNEGMAAALDPEFHLEEALAPYARRLVAQQHTPAAIARQLGQAGIHVAQFGAELPEHLQRLLDVVEGSGLEVHLRADELEPLARRAERVGNRVAAAVVAAACIEALAELRAADPGRSSPSPRRVFAAGLAAVGALGVYVADDARRGRRLRRR